MKVRAIQKGYYNHRRRAIGDIFEVMDKKAFSHRWMELVDGPAAPKPDPKPKEEPAPEQASSKEVI